MTKNTCMGGTGLASIGFRALSSLRSCAFCIARALFALQQRISVLEHCHAIDTSQLIATGLFRLLRVMPFTAPACALQLQASGERHQQAVHTCAKRSVWLLYHKHGQVATYHLFSVNIHLTDNGAKAVVSIIRKKRQLRPVVQEIPEKRTQAVVGGALSCLANVPRWSCSVVSC